MMPLIIITGLPCSGKTYRAKQIAAQLKDYISSSSDPSSSKRAVQIIPSHHASLDSPCDSDKPQNPNQGLLRDQIYNNAAQEKTARAEEFSAIKRALSKDNIVIADGLNYIKGYRYQLWCEAKAVGTRCCVVHVAVREDECTQWNRERLRAWGRVGESEDGAEDNDVIGVEKQAPGKQGRDLMGELVPESHTAIYGDRVAEMTNRSRSSSLHGLDGNEGASRANDTMTLKSLYINDQTIPESLSRANLFSPPSQPPVSEPSLSATIPPPSPTSSPPYTPSTLQSLLMRYEPPSPFSRWDTPLFTIPSSDTGPPTSEIWAALYPPSSKPTSKKALSQLPPSSLSSSTPPHQPPSSTVDVVKPHAATVLPRATASDALQTLESATMDVVKSLLAQAREQNLAAGEGGDVAFSVPLSMPNSTSPSSVETSLYIPPGVTLSQPLLQRLRRKYTQIQRGGIAHGQGYVSGRRQVVEGFVGFLAAEWNDDDDQG